MAGKDDAAGAASELTRLVHRQICRTENARHLGRLPAFSLNLDRPRWLDDLICRLEETEGSAG